MSDAQLERMDRKLQTDQQAQISARIAELTAPPTARAAGPPASVPASPAPVHASPPDMPATASPPTACPATACPATACAALQGNRGAASATLPIDDTPTASTPPSLSAQQPRSTESAAAAAQQLSSSDASVLPSGGEASTTHAHTAYGSRSPPVTQSKIIGLDPGRRTVYMAVSSSGPGQRTPDGDVRKMEAAEWRQKTGQTSRNREMKAARKSTMVSTGDPRHPTASVAQLESNIPSARTSCSLRLRTYFRALTWLWAPGSVGDFYARPRWRQADLTAYIKTQRAMDQMVKHATDNDRSVIVGFGNASVNKGPMGCPGVPVAAFRRALQR